MIVNKEYRGMSFTNEDERDELGYSVIFKYYRTEERLIDGTKVYGINVESKLIYNNNQKKVEEEEISIIISGNEIIANQIIEIFRINRVGPEGLEDVYKDVFELPEYNDIDNKK